jgi:hypothetical protein
MNKSRSILDWAITLLFSLIVTPWTILIGLKLAFLPGYLTNREKGIVSNIRSETHEATALSVVADFAVIGLVSSLTPKWISMYLWLALIISYLFLLEVLILTLEDKSSSEVL